MSDIIVIEAGHYYHILHKLKESDHAPYFYIKQREVGIFDVTFDETQYGRDRAINIIRNELVQGGAQAIGSINKAYATAFPNKVHAPRRLPVKNTSAHDLLILLGIHKGNYMSFFVKCKKCGSNISCGEEKCGSCGNPQPNPHGSWMQQVLAVSIVLLIIVGITLANRGPIDTDNTVVLHNEYGVDEGRMDRKQFERLCKASYYSMGKHRQRDCNRIVAGPR